VPSRNRRGGRLFQIPGMTPSLLNLEPGCAFRNRCPRGNAFCLDEPPVRAASHGRQVRCFNPHEAPLEEVLS